MAENPRTKSETHARGRGEPGGENRSAVGDGNYAFDPRDHHGPTLYYAALPIAWLRGERTLADLSETTVRLVPALAGTIAVVLIAVLASSFGRWPALAAAALMAVAPPAVYYSRYFIQETLLVTFTLGAFVCAQRWWRSGDLAWAIGAGACAGLMQATKATAPPSSLPHYWECSSHVQTPPAGARRGHAVSAALLSALAVAALFYSSFGTHPAGLRDAIAVYAPATERATGGSGHEKPWWYYLRMYGWHQKGDCCGNSSDLPCWLYSGSRWRSCDKRPCFGRLPCTRGFSLWSSR